MKVKLNISHGQSVASICHILKHSLSFYPLNGVMENVNLRNWELHFFQRAERIFFKNVTRCGTAFRNFRSLWFSGVRKNAACLSRLFLNKIPCCVLLYNQYVSSAGSHVTLCAPSFWRAFKRLLCIITGHSLCISVLRLGREICACCWIGHTHIFPGATCPGLVSLLHSTVTALPPDITVIY